MIVSIIAPPTMSILPEHENYPVDNIKNSEKYGEENKEKQIHSCCSNFILVMFDYKMVYHKNNTCRSWLT